MPNTAQSILVNAPVHDVFEFVADYRNITRFEKRFSRVVRLDGPDHGLGMTLDAKGRFHGVPVHARLQVVEFAQDRKIVSRSLAGLKSLLEWEFSEEGGATRVKLFANYGWPFPLIPKQVKDSIRVEVEEMTAESLRELKRLVEDERGREDIDGGS